MVCWISDFHLRPFLISLLTEQIAGFYDDKTKTVNLLDWIEPDEQKGVLAHELTHALQDQKVDLSKWSDVEAKGIAKNKGRGQRAYPGGRGRYGARGGDRRAGHGGVRRLWAEGFGKDDRGCS